MSVAALQAVALPDCWQQSHGRPLWQAPFRKTAKIIDTPWAIAVGADLALRLPPPSRCLSESHSGPRATSHRVR